MKADGILDHAGRFDIDQPTECLGRISQKGVVPGLAAGEWTKKGCVVTHPNPNREHS